MRGLQRGLSLLAAAALLTALQGAEAQAAEYVDRVLRGTKPAELPVQEPVMFDLWVNLKTAKAIGITIPESVLLRAEKVIE
jgi:putative ABC transport system substrate-binding protein